MPATTTIKTLIVQVTFDAGPLGGLLQANQPIAIKQQYGFQVGDTMPFHVVDFVAGAKDSGCGCPSVMISNSRTRGVEIWSRSAGKEAFDLAAAVEKTLTKDSKQRMFLILFDDPDKESVAAQAKANLLSKCYVAVPRTSTSRKFKLADGANGSDLIVFFMDRKQIKARHSFKPGDLNKKTMDSLADEAKKFLTGED